MNDNDFFKLVWDGMKVIFDMSNVGFIACNILWVFIIRMTGKKSFKKTKVTKAKLFLRRIPGAYFVLLQSIILAIIWAFLFRYTTREQTAELFFSITLSMIIWKLGVEKLINSLIKK